MPTGKYKRTAFHRQRQHDGFDRYWGVWRAEKLASTTSKVCAMCKTDKPIVEFYKRAVATWYPNCKSCESERRKQYKETTARSSQNNRLRKYGMTFADYESLYEGQEGLCAICRQPNNRNMLLAVDHDHVSGKVRALLCNNCNLVLGLALDDPIILRRMADYIESHREG